MSGGLSSTLVEKIGQILTQHPQIHCAILYGSRAKGTHTPGSDIDITLQGDGLDLRLLNTIRNALDDLLTPYSFDLSLMQDIDNPALRAHIERVGIILYKKAP